MKCDLLPVKPFFTSFKVFPERETMENHLKCQSLRGSALSKIGSGITLSCRHSHCPTTWAKIGEGGQEQKGEFYLRTFSIFLESGSEINVTEHWPATAKTLLIQHPRSSSFPFLNFGNIYSGMNIVFLLKI